MKTVLAFGTFDIYHPGHEFFQTEAKKLGDTLVVAVAPDEVVQELKGHSPTFRLSDRVVRIKQSNIADTVVAADSNSGSWKIISDVKPDIIATGYDQEGLRKALKKYLNDSERAIEVVTLPAFRPDEYNSSILRKKLSSEF